jgi:hypothetical protein
MSRHFTLQEATDHLGIVKPVLADAVRLKRKHDEVLGRLKARPTGDPKRTASSPVEEVEVQSLRKDITDRLEFIKGLGIQIKDLDHGLVDFPTVRNGEEVLLCWHLGEAAIGYWHTYEDGFPGRRPL